MKLGIHTRPGEGTTDEAPGRMSVAAPKSRLWLWLVALFGLQLVAWTAWFIVASHFPVEEVPLATSR
jgi:hypothetical protein